MRGARGPPEAAGRVAGARGNSPPRAVRVRPDVLPQRVRTDVGGEDAAFGVGRDAGRAGDAGRVGVGEVGVGNEGAQRAVDGAADRDAPDVAGVHRRVRLRVAHVERVVGRHVQGAGTAELPPGGDEVAVLVEDLHPVVAAVGDEDVALRAADGDVVGLVELAGSVAGAAPGLEEPAVAGELQHAVVGAVPVGDEDVAVGRNGHAGRPVEGIRAAAGHAGFAERHQYLALGAELEDLLAQRGARERAGRGARRHPEHRGVPVRVGRPEVALPVDGEAVGEREHPGAQARQEPSGRIELQDRRVGAADARCVARRHGVEAAVEDPDAAVGIELHADELAPAAAVHVRRQGRPVLDQPVRVGELELPAALAGLGLGSGGQQDAGGNGPRQRRSRAAGRRQRSRATAGSP